MKEVIKALFVILSIPANLIIWADILGAVESWGKYKWIPLTAFIFLILYLVVIWPGKLIDKFPL
jgi:hypothetical protein